MILVTGKNGFIASQLIKSISQKMPDKKIIGTTRSNDNESIFLDLNDISSFDFSIINSGDTIIHTAAESSPDKCNNSHDEAYRINVTNTIKFIDSCIARGAKVLFFSSDTVFGEKNEEFFEDEILTPLGEYAKMKAAVENYYMKNNAIKIFHLSYVFDKDDKFMQYLKSCSRNSSAAEIFAPFDRSVIYIKDVIEATIAIVNQWDTISTNNINLAGPELVSREMMANFFSKNIDGHFQYEVITPPDSFFIARPKIINMKSKYLSLLLGRQPISIKLAMSHELEGK